MFTNLPISQKLLVPGLLGVMILVTASTVFWINRLDSTLEAAFETEISITEQFISPPLTEAIWDFNEGLVTSSLSGLETFDSFVFARVYSDGAEFAAFSLRPEWSEEWDARIEELKSAEDVSRVEYDNVLYMVTDLTRDGEKVGELYWAFTREFIVAKVVEARSIAVGIGALSFVVFSVLLFLISRSVVKPIQGIVKKIDLLQSGAKDFDLPEAARRDEVGLLGKALASFREALLDTERLAEEQRLKDEELQQQEHEQLLRERAQEAALQEEREARAARERESHLEAVEAERKRQQDRQAHQDKQELVVRTLGDALNQFSKGNLDCAIAAPFPAAYEVLRTDFNSAVRQLGILIGGSLDKSRAILGDTNAISDAAHGLANRSERQAATLGHTAGALESLTKGVEASADVAKYTRSLVRKASASALEGEKVVEKTISAIGEIEGSSDRIANITGVIEDIAFQTNLLALNAGVEAARAGDAGDGFAVVASEVRGLAARSSEAASEITKIIADSASSVERGAQLVRASGAALSTILESITEISERVEELANKSQEIAVGVVDVNGAMSELDQTTQENVAMFEETTAALSSLNAEAESLQREMGQLTVSAATTDAPKQAALTGT